MARHFKNQACPGRRRATAWSVLVVAMLLGGCQHHPPLPPRDELVQLLGTLAEDVVVLGGESQSRVADTEASKSGASPLGQRQTKLWLVRSQQPLPRPGSHHQPSRAGNRFEKPGSSVLCLEDAFSARVLYDIAAALQISANALPQSSDEKIASGQGRLTEWSKDSWIIRVRDFQAESGWLSVVEAFDEPGQEPPLSSAMPTAKE